VAVVGDLLGERAAGGGGVAGERDPDAGGDVDRGKRGVAAARAFVDQRTHRGPVLGREEKRERAVGELTGQAEHRGAHGAEIDRGHARRGES
jgi:hypothetical protein